MNTLTTCKAVGYLFLTLVTLVEIIVLCNIFNIDEHSITRTAAISATAIIFNSILWWFSHLYHKTKNTLETDTKE